MPMSSIYPQTAFSRPQPMGYQPPQVPGMSLNMPLGMFQQPSTNELVGVHGLASALKFPVKPNTTVPVFDLDSDHAFILNADANGIVSPTIIRFEVVTEEQYRKETESSAIIQMTKGEYDELTERLKTVEEELKNAKQFVQSQNEPVSTTVESYKSSAKSAKSSAANNGSAV